MRGLRNNITLVGNIDGRRRANFDTPLVDSDFNHAIPLLDDAKQLFDAQGRIRVQQHCGGRYKSPIDGQYYDALWYTLPIRFVANKIDLPNFMALAHGAAEAPFGTPEDHVSLLDITAVSGTVVLTASDVSSSKASKAVPYNATAAQIQEALEENDLIGFGNMTVEAVVGEPGQFHLTYTGKFANSAPSVSIGGEASEGADLVAVTTVTGGEASSHIFTEVATQILPTTDFIIGYENHSDSFVRLNNCGVDNIRIIEERNQDVLVEVDLIIADVQDLDDYTPPACTNYPPIRMSECMGQLQRMAAGQYVTLTDDLQSIRYTRANKIVTDDDSFPFGNSNKMYVIEANDPETFVDVTIRQDHRGDLFKDAEAISRNRPQVYYRFINLVGPPAWRTQITLNYALFNLTGKGNQGSKNRATFTARLEPTIPLDNDPVEQIMVNNNRAIGYLMPSNGLG